VHRFVSAINPSARAARGRYGPDGEAVDRLLDALARLSPMAWDSLVRANDQADRHRPPDSDASSLRQVDYMTAAGNDAARIALAAAGPAAADAWRLDLGRVGRESRGETGASMSYQEEELARRAWGYRFAAQHMAWLVVNVHRRGRSNTRREWEPYEHIVAFDTIVRR
jgi:hypothetical protein